MLGLKAMCGGLGRCGQVQAIRQSGARIPGEVNFDACLAPRIPRLPFQPHRHPALLAKLCIVDAMSATETRWTCVTKHLPDRYYIM